MRVELGLRLLVAMGIARILGERMSIRLVGVVVGLDATKRDPLAEVEDANVWIRRADPLDPRPLEGETDTRGSTLASASLANLVWRRLIGVRAESRLDQRLDLDMPPPDPLDEGLFRQDADEHPRTPAAWAKGATRVRKTNAVRNPGFCIFDRSPWRG